MARGCKPQPFCRYGKRVSQTDGRSRLAFARRGGADSRHQYQLAVRFILQAVQKLIGKLGFETPIMFKATLAYAQPGCHLVDWLQLGSLCDFDVVHG
jgi:hypothetical protein